MAEGTSTSKIGSKAEIMLLAHCLECPSCWRHWLRHERASCMFGAFLSLALDHQFHRERKSNRKAWLYV